LGPSTSEENKYEKKLVPTRIERCLWLGKKEEKATNVTGIEPMPIPAQEVANPTAELNCPCVRTAVYVFFISTLGDRKKPLKNKGSAEIEPATFHLREDRFSMLLSSTIIACPATSTTWTRAIG